MTDSGRKQGPRNEKYQQLCGRKEVGTENSRNFVLTSDVRLSVTKSNQIGDLQLCFSVSWNLMNDGINGIEVEKSEEKKKKKK